MAFSENLSGHSDTVEKEGQQQAVAVQALSAHRTTDQVGCSEIPFTTLSSFSKWLCSLPLYITASTEKMSLG